MSFDVDETLSRMRDAVKRAVSGEWPGAKDCIARALEEEKRALADLARARIAGEIDDGTLGLELRDEARTLEAVLLACRIAGRETIHDAASAAMRVFHDAVMAAVETAAAGRAGPSAAGRGKRAAKKPALALSARKLNARPDTVDFRDLMYVPTLVEVDTERPLDEYEKHRVPILDQGQEGACAGYGLATVVHYLLRTRKVIDTSSVSPWMLYAMARRYDEWRGEAYEGSSCRGAMKGWHKHGVCEEKLWTHDARKPDLSLDGRRASDALLRPLGAYFRVNHKDLVAVHAAISEVGVLYASAGVHSGWEQVKANGFIPLADDDRGGHAFAIVAYDKEGFWIQNSWGRDWGRRGFGRISYEDWLKNGTDMWVARLGVPVDLPASVASHTSAFTSSALARAYTYDDIRPHVVSLGNDGQLRTSGNIGTPPQQLARIFTDDFPNITQGWNKRRLVLYAHGGLVSEDAAVQRVSDYRRAMLAAECYPLAFVWHSDYWSALGDLLDHALKLRRPEGVLGAAKDFMLDRLDDALEPIARKLTGKAAWDEMKKNALAATASATGGARLALEHVARLVKDDPKIEIHVAGHSAGSIFHAPLVRLLTAKGVVSGTLLNGETGYGLPLATCTLWAPACTMALFEEAYAPAIADGSIGRFALYTLTDSAERDDNCAQVYHKSLLYLVSDAFEKYPRIPVLRPEGEPLLGMEKFVEKNATIEGLLGQKRMDWVRAPNGRPQNDMGASTATHHGDFDDDIPTVTGTLARICGAAAAATAPVSFRPGASWLRNVRRQVDAATR